MDEFPDIIYLQCEEVCDSWEGITWCADKVDDSDIKYFRADTVKMMEKHTGEYIKENAYVSGVKQERARIVGMLRENGHRLLADLVEQEPK